MRKAMMFIITLGLLFLSGCIEPTLDRLDIYLNPGVDTIEIHSDYLDPGATSSYGFLDLEPVVKSSNLDTKKVGVYEIIYVVTYNNLEKEIKRIITVVDQTPPVLSLNPGVDTILLGQEWTDGYVEASDNSGVLPVITVFGFVDVDIPGVYIITYTAEDQSGNESSIKRYVEVIDPKTLNIS